MEQFRQVGEVLGSMKALMVLSDEIPINKKQCSLILDIFSMAFTTIAAEIRQNLRLEEKNTKWRSLEQPLRELYRVFKEAELYLRHCLDSRDWWAKVISLHGNKNSIELHIHNLLCNCFAVIEAVEVAIEISGTDPDEIETKGVLLRRKYDNVWNDPKLFGLMYGEKYLISREMCRRFKCVLKEDQWLLVESLKEKKASQSSVWTKNEKLLCDLLIKKLNESYPNNLILFPSSILTGAKDFQVRRRIGDGSQLKEIQWLGESFSMRHIIGVIDPLKPEIFELLSLSHPNVLRYLCGFHEEEKQECFLVMEPMNKDLGSHIKENSSPRRRNLMPIPIIVDIMLQIARGMEYLHSRNIYHGELNPSNVLLKSRTSSEGYFHVKVSGFGLQSVKKPSPRSSPNLDSVTPFIWYAPELLAEQETPDFAKFKYSEKADVYSFGMVCFEILTGKVPFEDGHLQGDKISRNIRAGERPLFPFGSPKFLVSLTKKCWQHDVASRPSFGSICRILRYIKKFVVMNPESAQSELQNPVPNFCEIENGFLKRFVSEENLGLQSVSEIPFEMFSFRLSEKSVISYGKDDNLSSTAEDVVGSEPSDRKPVGSSNVCEKRNLLLAKKDTTDAKSVDSDVSERKVSPEKKTKSIVSNGSDKKNRPISRDGNKIEERKSSTPWNPILSTIKGPRTKNGQTPAVETTREKHISNSET